MPELYVNGIHSEEVRTNAMSSRPASSNLPSHLGICPKDATAAHKVGQIAWIQRTPMWVHALLISVGMTSVGCAGSTSEATDQPVETHVSTSTSNPTIFGGEKDDDSLAANGVVALRVGSGSTFELCSGTLIAANVVLTARHCITKNLTTSVSCDENGNSANGKHVESDQSPAAVGIYTGASPSFAMAPVTTARAIVSPTTAPYLCDADIALVVLVDPITDVQPMAVRIHSSARKGEMIRSVGYGQNDQASPIGTRFRKDDVEVLAQGRMVSPSKTPLGLHEFEVGKSICQGDSGGPAISQDTGAVIGVVSRGGGCDDDFGHIYTTTAGFEDMFADAFQLAGAEPIAENDDGAASSTLARSTAQSSTTSGDAAAGTGGCSIGQRGARSGAAGGETGLAGLAGVVILAAAFGARARRRRHAV
jgi:hypothetical protein